MRTKKYFNAKPKLIQLYRVSNEVTSIKPFSNLLRVTTVGWKFEMPLIKSLFTLTSVFEIISISQLFSFLFLVG